MYHLPANWQRFQCYSKNMKILRFCFPKEPRLLNGNFDNYCFFSRSSFSSRTKRKKNDGCYCLLECCEVIVVAVMVAIYITITQWLTQIPNFSSIILSKHSKIIWINFVVHTVTRTHIHYMANRMESTLFTLWKKKMFGVAKMKKKKKQKHDVWIQMWRIY